MAGKRRNRREGDRFNVWRSYSDMMAGVLLLFVLIMCVTLFQAQKNYVEKLAEQEQRIRIQDEYAEEMKEKEAELEAQDSLLAEQKKKLEEQNLTLDELQAALEEQAKILADKETTLEEQAKTLSQQETALAKQQATMDEQQATLQSQQATMEEQRTALDAQQATLEEQQKLLDSQSAEITSQTQLLQEKQAEIDSKTQLLQDKQAQIDRIIGVKADVIEALRKEFSDNNVNVKIDAQTGALVLDSNVMFAYDDTMLSEEGQEVLRQVLPIYCSVLLSEEYIDNIGEIIIDGYTDTDGTYEYNLQLSQSRSLAVADYLLSIEDEFLNGDEAQILQDILTVNGHSWSNPILDSAGNVDMDASRRVEVKFRLKDEEMIEELRALIE